MKNTLPVLLQGFVDRTGLAVSRVSRQAEIPKQTLFNWLGGRSPRWHPQLPEDLARLSSALGLDQKETNDLLMAAGCICAVDTPYSEETTMENLKLPRGWHRAGSHPLQYKMGIDPDVHCEKYACAQVRSRVARAEGFGTLMQSCKPDSFLGKRVRMSAMARTKKIKSWAGLWLRIDGPEEGKSLNFDNMQDRPLQGTSDWQRYSVVLDVPKEAIRLAYGVLLGGDGSVWIADMKMEVVDADVPTTNVNRERRVLPDVPVNLDFSD